MTKRRTNQNRPDPKRNPIEIEAAAGSGPAGPAPEREGPFDGKDWLRLLYENARIGIAIVRLDGTFLSANPAACRILGYREEQIAGKTFASITHPDDVEISLAHFRKLVAGECESYDLIKRYLHKDGRDVDALITVSLVRDDAGRPRYVLAQVEDLSRQRRITKELRETEIHYRSLFENMLNGLAYCRVIYEEGRPVDFVYLDVNRAFEKRTGLAGVIGKKVTQVIPGICESNPEVLEIYGRVALTGAPEVFEAYVEPLDKWFAVSVYSPRSEHFIAAFDVITDRKRAEMELARSEAKHRSVFENAAEGIVIAKDGMIVMANPATARVTGRSEEELLSTPFTEFIHPDDREMVFRHHVARLEGREAPGSYEFRLLNRDGTVRWVEIRPVLIPWEGERATLNFLTDVTERREAEHVLAVSEETYRSIFSSANDAIFVHDAETGAILDVNDMATQMLGYTAEELRRMQVGDLTETAPGYGQEEAGRLVRAAGGGEPQLFEWPLKRKNGDRFWCEVNLKSATIRGRPCVLALARDITARKRAEVDLRLSEEKHRMLLDHAGVGVGYWDLEGRAVLFNRLAAEHMGGAREDFEGKTLAELYGSEMSAIAKRRMEEVIRAEERRDYTDEVTLAGVSRWFLSTYTPMKDAAGKPSGVQVISHDITARKRAEEEVREARDRAQQYLDVAGTILVALDAEGNVALLNRRGYEILGHDDDLTGKSWFDTCLPEWMRADVRGVFDRIMAGEGESLAQYVSPVITRGGEERMIEWRNALLRDSAGVIRGTLSSGEDVTERLRAEEELRDSASRLRAITDSAGDAIIMMDPKGNVSFWNPAAEKIFGFAATEVAGNDLHRLLVPEQYLDAHRIAFERFRRTGEGDAIGRGVELQARRKDGAEITVWLSLSRVRIKDEWHAVGVVRDITDQKRVEAERARLETAFEQAGETVVITDTEGTILYVNPAFTKISGYTREEAIGRNPKVLKSGEHDAAFYKRLWETIRGGETWQGRFRNKRKDGTVYTEDATISPVRDRSGTIVNFVAVKRDVTDLVRLESDLRQAQKMEAIGTLAGGIAHDFNNILYSILGFTDLAMDSVPRETRTRRCLEGIREAGARGTELVSQILAFSRRKERERRPLLLQEVVPQTMRLLAGTAPPSVNIRQTLDPACGSVLGDRTECQQIVMNLCSNAFHAMQGKGGDLDIRLEEVRLDGANVRASGLPRGGRYARLSVGDTGYGIDESTARRMFEPYFTTKPVGEGTGLGLSTVLGIVQAMEGSVRAESAPGRGARFDVLLPVHEPTNDAPAPRADGNGLENSPPTEVEHAADSRGR